MTKLQKDLQGKSKPKELAPNESKYEGTDRNKTTYTSKKSVYINIIT
jgi:hypothetical protein